MRTQLLKIEATTSSKLKRRDEVSAEIMVEQSSTFASF